MAVGIVDVRRTGADPTLKYTGQWSDAPTGHPVCVPLPAMGEWYTLGLAREVDDLAGDDVAENNGSPSSNESGMIHVS